MVRPDPSCKVMCKKILLNQSFEHDPVDALSFIVVSQVKVPASLYTHSTRSAIRITFLSLFAGLITKGSATVILFVSN